MSSGVERGTSDAAGAYQGRAHSPIGARISGVDRDDDLVTNEKLVCGEDFDP
ncbi:hypothetical protein [Streptomyces sp. NBC_01615]|uniref:hypothetical protein n=1 Tax=Streptomyces sp. NBC_01615 TaxID=2975898 RepID=UPI0038630D80